MADIASVGVAPTYRRRGLLTVMTPAQLTGLHEGVGGDDVTTAVGSDGYGANRPTDIDGRLGSRPT